MVGSGALVAGTAVAAATGAAVGGAAVGAAVGAGAHATSETTLKRKTRTTNRLNTLLLLNEMIIETNLAVIFGRSFSLLRYLLSRLLDRRDDLFAGHIIYDLDAAQGAG